MTSGIEVIQGPVLDWYEHRVVKVYADRPELWKLAIGAGLWFQFGVYAPLPGEQTLDQTGQRYLELQLELAGIRPGSPRITRVLDVGCGWGASLEYLARAFPDCQRIDGINISASQLDYALRRVTAAGVGDRVQLYQCNARDISLLPDPAAPYDLVLMRGCITHCSPQTLDAALSALSARTYPETALVISENLHNTPLREYQSALPDGMDRLACGHRKTREFLTGALERHGFAVRDVRPLPTNADAVRWLVQIKGNIERNFGDEIPQPLMEMRDVTDNWSAALEIDTVSVYSIIASPA
ncbi:hypothetical protein CTZ27_33445 [Streptomyces griseocarneus]|nr:hypothetical protein CTZ27_33445 [Streptomyces griseocarneus]